MSKFVIEKNVSAPMAGRKKYPWGQMEVGDSILFTVAEGGLAANAAYTFGLRYGKKFTKHAVEGGIRIWRIA